MHHYIAFLRGINLGRRRIKMNNLRALFEKMKFAKVETFIASGNVIFSSRTADSRKIEKQIESHLEKSLGYDVDTFVRTRAEVAAVAKFQPFPNADVEAPGHRVYCSFLREPLGSAHTRGLIACRTEVDEFCVEGREFYWLGRIPSVESKVWASPQMRALKLPSSSARNLTTIRKLAALYPPPAG
jgi:uncharacterized protein (DUF1697 family)